MSKKKEVSPGDGIKSLKTSNIFRLVNFELYTKPNMVIMALGLTAFLGCTGYIAYMRYRFESMGYYSVVTEDGTEKFEKRKSRWD